MQLGIPEWMTGFLSLQSITSSETQQNQYVESDETSLDCAAFFAPTPRGFEGSSLAVVRDNLAVIPVEWDYAGLSKPWFAIEGHTSLQSCMSSFQDTSFIAFHEDFLHFIGHGAKLEMIHEFRGDDAQHVHEAPVYVSATNELVFADTSVIGWLWAVEIDTHKARKLNINPPLPNVNGGTLHDSMIYLTTNGGDAPALWNCSVPTGVSTTAIVFDSNAFDEQNPAPNTILPSNHRETINCTAVVNNYHLAHLNSPNDLIFTSQGNILFTDPTYGWTQGWPGLSPPQLPTAIYHFNTTTRALITLDNDMVLQPNGVTLTPDGEQLFVADSNSTSDKPIRLWEHSVRNIYGFDFDESTLSLKNKRLVHVVENGWPDGLRLTRSKKKGKGNDILLVAGIGGVDVVDVSRGGGGGGGGGGGAGVLLGKWNVGNDMIFNLDPVVKGQDFEHRIRERSEADTWLLTGKKGIYKVSVTRSS